MDYRGVTPAPTFRYDRFGLVTLTPSRPLMGTSGFGFGETQVPVPFVYPLAVIDINCQTGYSWIYGHDFI